MAKGKKGKKTGSAASPNARSTLEVMGGAALHAVANSHGSPTAGRNGLQAALENLRLDPELGMDLVANGILGREGEELSPRLLALQQQLERLDQDRFLLQRVNTDDEPLASLNASATKTELSLQSLKKRLGEVRQQLYGVSVSPAAASAPASATSLAHLAKTYFGGMIRGKRTLAFPGEGEAFDEAELEEGDFEFEISDSEYYEELANGHSPSGAADRLLDATRLGLRLFERCEHGAEEDDDNDDDGDRDDGEEYANGGAHAKRANGIGAGAGASRECFDLATRAEGGGVEVELEAALQMVVTPNLPEESKLEALREKFADIVRQDRSWRSRVQRTTRLAHDERIQRQLVEIELDKANAIKHRLESLCRDLHNENRRIKAEGVRREELAAAAAREPPTDYPAHFPLPPLPEPAALAQEPSTLLVDRIVSLANLYLLREQHFALLLRQSHTEALASRERIDLLSSHASKHTSTLEANARRIAFLTRSEQELKAQVRQYVEKFRQVEETLGKSNDLFGTFRAEMEQMGAKLARLERENAQLNSKCATLSRNIIEMADERAKQNASIETLRGQKIKLEQLCRTLQAERNAALKGAPPGASED